MYCSLSAAFWETEAWKSPGLSQACRSSTEAFSCLGHPPNSPGPHDHLVFTIWWHNKAQALQTTWLKQLWEERQEQCGRKQEQEHCGRKLQRSHAHISANYLRQLRELHSWWQKENYSLRTICMDQDNKTECDRDSLKLPPATSTIKHR